MFDATAPVAASMPSEKISPAAPAGILSQAVLKHVGVMDGVVGSAQQWPGPATQPAQLWYALAFASSNVASRGAVFQ